MTLLQLLCYNINYYDDDFVLIVTKVVNLNIGCLTSNRPECERTWSQIE